MTFPCHPLTSNLFNDDFLETPVLFVLLFPTETDISKFFSLLLLYLLKGSNLSSCWGSVRSVRSDQFPNLVRISVLGCSPPHVILCWYAEFFRVVATVPCCELILISKWCLFCSLMCFTMISIVATIRNRVSEFEKNKQTNKQTNAIYRESKENRNRKKGIWSRYQNDIHKLRFGENIKTKQGMHPHDFALWSDLTWILLFKHVV